MTANLGDSGSRDPFSGPFRWCGYLLGFGLGGFFDGILLHQILQWHHLLSAVQGEAFRDLRVQVLADGLFHAAMYIVAVAGLWLLWRSRHAFGWPAADRLLFANTLIGFGAWHVIDGILSHWILGIHRIRMESAVPLLWDLGWFIVLGVGVSAAGVLLRRDPGPGRPSGRRRRPVAPSLLVLAVMAAGPVAALPPPNVTTVMVLFKPGTSTADVLTAVAALDGRAIWTDPSGNLWAIDVRDPGSAHRLYRHGALLVSTSLLPVGCFSWSRAI